MYVQRTSLQTDELSDLYATVNSEHGSSSLTSHSTATLSSPVIVIRGTLRTVVGRPEQRVLKRGKKMVEGIGIRGTSELSNEIRM